MALEGQGLHVETRIEYGSPAKKIIEVADEEKVDLIVIGAQGVTAAQDILVGSVAFEVVRRAKVPVLLFKQEVVRELGHLRCQRVCNQLFYKVLYPTDFSPISEAAFYVVKRLKTTGTEEVYLLHVQDRRVMKLRSPEQLEQFDHHDMERLETYCRALRLKGLKATPILRHGIPYQETLKVADETQSCLIVIGSKGFSAVQELLAGVHWRTLCAWRASPYWSSP